MNTTDLLLIMYAAACWGSSMLPASWWRTRSAAWLLMGLAGLGLAGLIPGLARVVLLGTAAACLITARLCWRGWQLSQQRRPTTWHNWPVSLGWGERWHLTWHAWPIAGSEQWPNAVAKEHGWTLHLGRLHVYFGRRFRPEVTP